VAHRGLRLDDGDGDRAVHRLPRDAAQGARAGRVRPVLRLADVVGLLRRDRHPHRRHLHPAAAVPRVRPGEARGPLRRLGAALPVHRVGG
jgi:hypothetical protein